jgi:hypothetical protein
MQKKLQILPNENESIIIKTESQDGMVQHRAVRYTCKIPQYQLCLTYSWTYAVVNSTNETHTNKIVCILRALCT